MTKPLTKQVTRFKGTKYERVYTCYTSAGLAVILPLINKAQEMANEDAANEPDAGTCVLGAGLVVDYVAPRKRTPENRLIVTVPHQGNTSISRSLKRAEVFLKENGVRCFYCDGVMD